MRKYTRAEGSASADDVCAGQRIAARGADVKAVPACEGACMKNTEQGVYKYTGCVTEK